MSEFINISSNAYEFDKERLFPYMEPWKLLHDDVIVIS